MAKRWMRLDPSRTKTERQRFMREMRRRMRQLDRDLYRFLVTEDAFGLEEKKEFKFNIANRRQYEFLTDPQKIRQFRQWLQQQIDAGLLQTVGGVNGKPWTAQYVESAYRKGMMRSYMDIRKEDLIQTPDWYRGTKEQFIRSAFMQPETMAKIELLATRAFEGMRGITESISTQMSRLLAEGLVNGYGPRKIASQMSKAIQSISRKRALVIARTEIIYAHAEGQLDGYGTLGVAEVQAEVEFQTAGDDRVCEECSSMEGNVWKVEEAHGIIPIHPNCRCAWMPVV